MQVIKVIDPRDPLERANRDQMREYAEKNGIKQINWAMAGDQMRFILRSLGVTDIGIPFHQLGTPIGSAVPSGKPAMNLADLQRQQWEQQEKDALSRYHEDTPVLTRAQLAKECKQKGIKIARTDTKEKLLERLNGKQTAA